MLAVIFFTQISWGTIGLCGVLFVSQNNKRFRTLEALVPSHLFAKNHSSPAACLLLNLLVLKFPLEVYFSVYGRAAFSINVAAEGEAYVEALGCFEGDAGGEGEAIAAIGFSFVGNGDAGEVG